MFPFDTNSDTILRDGRLKQAAPKTFWQTSTLDSLVSPMHLKHDAGSAGTQSQFLLRLIKYISIVQTLDAA